MNPSFVVNNNNNGVKRQPLKLNIQLSIAPRKPKQATMPTTTPNQTNRLQTLHEKSLLYGIDNSGL